MRRLGVIILILITGRFVFGSPVSNRLFDISQMAELTCNLGHFFMTNTTALEGAVFGLSELSLMNGPVSVTNGIPSRILLAVTNKGNYTDDTLTLSVAFGSYNPSYSGPLWDYYLEVGASNVGTTYQVPGSLFAPGAVLQFFLVVTPPSQLTRASTLDVTVSAEISNGSDHPSGVYTGFNGIPYGGYSNVASQVAFNMAPPLKILAIFANDGVDSITNFGGGGKLRKTRNTISIRLSSSPLQPETTRIWYSVAGKAAGPGGTNANQLSNTMTEKQTMLFSADIPERDLSGGNSLSFLFEIDGQVYDAGYYYLLGSLVSQGNFQTTVMNNWITVGANQVISLKLPESILGKRGKIQVYSISGDRQKQLLNSEAVQQIYTWDGLDEGGNPVSRGMYFVVIDIENVREVRNVFIR